MTDPIFTENSIPHSRQPERSEEPPQPPLTIGVFDSGFGGLTVLRALLPLIPHAHYLYLGDTARLPYGSKSRETIARYALSSARFLHQRGAQLLVIACNTATALALEDIQQALPIPVIGVIAPGAQAARAVNTIHPHHVLVLATAATVASAAYTRALTALGLEATEKACPLLVPLVEEDWLQDQAHAAVTREVLRLYLAEALYAAPAAQTLLLGCTHYPLLTPLIQQTLRTLHHPLHIIDSAEATAQAVAHTIQTHFPPTHTPRTPSYEFFATDSIEKFQQLGSHFLGRPLPPVQLIDLGG